MCEANIHVVCITQTTLEIINNVLLIHNWRFLFLWFDFDLDLGTCVNRMDKLWINLCKQDGQFNTSMCGGTQAINNQQPCKEWAWKGSRDHYRQFQNPKKVSEQTWLLDLWNAFYSRSETKPEQTMRLNPCEVIWLFDYFNFKVTFIVF